MDTIKALVLICFLWFPLAYSQGAFPEFIYADFDPNFATKVTLEHVNELSPEDHAIASPNHLNRYWTASPDFTVGSPWSTTIYLQQQGQPTLSLTLHHHANVFPQIVWLNDELLHIKVWWGRAVGSEFILHLPTEAFIYQSMVYWTSVMATTGLAEIPNFTLSLAHLEGARPEGFDRFEVSFFDHAIDEDDVRQILIEVHQPLYTECFLEAHGDEITAVYTLLLNLLAERAAELPPRPIETVCRNCTILELSWQVNGSAPESFVFSEQRPLRYPALDDLLPLVSDLLERMRAEGECGA